MTRPRESYEKLAAKSRRAAKANRIFGSILLLFSAIFTAVFFVLGFAAGFWNFAMITPVVVIVVSALSLFVSARTEDTTARSFDRISRAVSS